MCDQDYTLVENPVPANKSSEEPIFSFKYYGVPESESERLDSLIYSGEYIDAITKAYVLSNEHYRLDEFVYHLSCQLHDLSIFYLIKDKSWQRLSEYFWLSHFYRCPIIYRETLSLIRKDNPPICNLMMIEGNAYRGKIIYGLNERT